ncbi:hypothetical protein ACCT28_23005 [Rhizobium ruizarguesonis]
MAAKDVAEWMIEFMGQDYWLYQEIVVYEIRDRFGEDYVYLNQSGNLAISRAVLKEFRKLTEGKLVWERGERAWRPARVDEAGKRSAD